MKKFLIVLAVAAFALTGCSNGPDAGGSIKGTVVNLPDGDTVMCVIWKDGYAGGVTCDWGS